MGDDEGTGIAVDVQGNAYLTGYARSSNFPVADALQATKGADNCTTAPCPDAFVARLDASGSTLTYSTYLGGSNEDYGRGIAVDGTGAAYVIGQTLSTDFPTTPGAYDTLTDGLKDDAFVAKISMPAASTETQVIQYTYDPLGRMTAADYDDLHEILLTTKEQLC